MIIHLIRHTTPDIAKGICYGQADIGLANSFEQERDAVLSQLLPHYDALYSSPLYRCKQLADCISASHQTTSENIMEYNFGDWELKSWDQVRQLNSTAWFNDFVNIASPNGESFQQMHQRVTDFIETLITQDYETVAVVTHSGVQRLVWAWLLDIPLQNIFRLDIAYGEVFELNYDQVNKTGKIKSLSIDRVN